MWVWVFWLWLSSSINLIKLTYTLILPIRTLQIRQIAKKYKTQYQELIKTNEEEKKKKEAVVMSLEEQEKLREEGRQEAESRQAERINQLTEQVSFILLIKSNISFQTEL